ncbi:hypothetical protein [Sulfuricurvum sp.]|uniref:hypothetical protein n=1 Tax=Sulfuricurvum sp. TaxID=2025608 RepID=UPI002E31C1AA|nr:hypothetical protein [Sulfuricurvum sp.]HEX5330627.1 hypothetical protein [Sulfuricurvum sp.]
MKKVQPLKNGSEADNYLYQGIARPIVDICETILSHKEVFRPKKIKFYIHQNLDVNASAKKMPKSLKNFFSDNHYLIEINQGAILFIHRTILDFFHNKNFMPKVKSEDDVDISWLSSNLSLYKNIPANRQRIEYAGNITILSSIIFFYHEMAHVLRGHLDYIGENYSMSMLAMDDEYDLRINNIIKALEADADYQAGEFLGIMFNREKELFYKVLEINNDLDFFKKATMAARFSFQLLDNKFKSKKYHLPHTRFEVFLEGLLNKINIDQDKALEIATGLFIGMEKACNTFGYRSHRQPAEIEEDGEQYRSLTAHLLYQLESELNFYRQKK